MATKLVKFGAGEFEYVIPTFQAEYKDNFMDAVPRTARMPGMSGGVDAFGKRPAPSEIGSVQAGWTLVSDEDPTGMTALRDAARKMLAWGKLPLWMQTSNDGVDDLRFCMARLNNLDIAENRDRLTDYWQKVKAIWQVNDPRWLGWPSMDYYGDGTNWDDGGTWAGPRLATTVNNGTTLTLTNNGTTKAPVKFRFKDTTDTVANLELARMDQNGNLVEGFIWGGLLAANDALVVDGHSPMRVIYEDAALGHRSGYPEFTRLGGKGFIYLEPGANTIEVAGVFSGAVSVEIEWFDAWK